MSGRAMLAAGVKRLRGWMAPDRACEARLRAEVDRANRYQYYLGVAAWARPAHMRLSPSPLTAVSTPEELWALARELTDDTSDISALDIGSGIRPFSLRRYAVHVCLEPYEPYVRELTARFRRNASVVPLLGAAPGSLELFAAGSFDAVILADVLEHLSRDDGLQTIAHAKRIARRHVHVFTPDGFVAQHVGPLDTDEWGFVGNELQSHVSGWTESDFDGWRVIRCAEYQTVDGRVNGAIWATFTNIDADRSVPATLWIFDPFEPSADWEAWLGALEERMDFRRAVIHPALAPWSHTGRPTPRLPAGVVSVGLDALDLTPSGEYIIRGANAGTNDQRRSVVVLGVPGDVRAAMERSDAHRLLALVLGPAEGVPTTGRSMGGRYRIVSMPDTAAIPSAIEWLLDDAR